MLSVSSRIWTRVAVTISCDDNHYTTGTSIFFSIALSFHISLYSYRPWSTNAPLPSHSLTHSLIHSFFFSLFPLFLSLRYVTYHLSSNASISSLSLSLPLSLSLSRLRYLSSHSEHIISPPFSLSSLCYITYHFLSNTLFSLSLSPLSLSLCLTLPLSHLFVTLLFFSLLSPLSLSFLFLLYYPLFPFEYISPFSLSLSLSLSFSLSSLSLFSSASERIPFLQH